MASPESSQTQPTSADRAPLPFADLNPQQQRQRLIELAQVFFRLGTIAFGGPAAHIAMMDDEVVKRRQWLSREKLLDLIGVTSLIPGPNSTELAIHIGYERGGWRGLLVAGGAFILPAMTLVWILAALYARYQTVPQVEWLLYGVKPVIIAIVLQALWKLGGKALKDWPTRVAAVAVVVGYFFSVSELLLLFLAGLAVMLYKNWRQGSGSFGGWLLPTAGVMAQVGTATPAVPPVGVLPVFLFFLKIGAVLYGSGYVLLAFLQRDLVEQYQWITSQQLLDAVAIGQFTPGPVFTTATFVGYLVAGNGGAIAATVGIFLPAFVLVGVINPWVPALRRSRWFSAFLDGVNAASLGLMAAVTYTLGQSALVDGLTGVLALFAVVAVFRFKVNSVWLILLGGAVGFVAQQWMG